MNKLKIYIFCFFIIQILSTPICIINSNHCSKCNQLTNLCFKCEKQDSFIPDDKGGCKGTKACIPGINYCNECDLEGKLCYKCDDGYYIDENGGCSSTPNCKISYKGGCIECKQNYLLLGSDNKYKFCKSLLSNDYLNCKEIDINNGECKICEDGYFLNEGDRRCIKTENCYESIFGNCISCIHNYYLDKRDNKCYKKDDNFEGCKMTLDGENCEMCNLDYYFDKKGKCSYTNYCFEIKNKKCIKCIEGYYLTKDNQCSDSDNCYYADKDTGLCITCNHDYYLDVNDYKCKTNLEDNEFKYCSQINNSGRCVTCEYNYRLGKDSKCSFTLYCEESEFGKCLKCEDNYYLGLDNYCTNIKHCIYSNYYKCVECEEMYYFDVFQNKCLEVKEQFQNCKISTEDGLYCSECKNGFTLNINNHLCYKE